MVDYLIKYGLVPHDCLTVKAGDRFGRITILAVGKLSSPKYKYKAVYRCDCGTEAITQCGTIQIGTTRSCGCIGVDRVKKHGLWDSPIYNIWQKMIRRCENINDGKYARYGARGISVCERWHDMTLFHEDMAPTHKKGLSIERLDNNRGYEKDNCEWVSASVQSRNKQNNINVTIDGRTQILKDWCIERGVSYGMVRTRIKDKGWDPAEALAAPPSPRKPS